MENIKLQNQRAKRLSENLNTGKYNFSKNNNKLNISLQKNFEVKIE